MKCPVLIEDGEKYLNQYVATESFSSSKVISYGTDAQIVRKEAQDKGYKNPVVFFNGGKDLKRNKRDYPYKSFRFSLHKEVHACSIKKLESIRTCHRGDFINSTIEFLIRSRLAAAPEGNKVTLPKSNIPQEDEFFW